tara:strand:+ start:5446 stop:5748 length:303 start_codon:yes stop_codon:yes gene_type:complete
MKKLKEKWGIESNFQLMIIFIVFSITGSLSLYVSAPILNFVGLEKGTLTPWLYIPLKLILVFPAYQVIILIVGAVFGQFRFFWKLEKKMLYRFGFKQFKD